MKRVFIQAHARYPHEGARANYMQNLAEAIIFAGYEVILVTFINSEYDMKFINLYSQPIVVAPIIPSENIAIRKEQRRTGYCTERFAALERYDVDKGDCVITLGVLNEYFLEKLFKLREKVGFRIICGVLELFEAKDYEIFEKYKEFEHIHNEVYLRSDAILSISKYIDNYYINKGMRVYRLPPFVNCAKYKMQSKPTDKYRFIIPSGKDSLNSMLMAFAGLKAEERDKIELHLCSIRKEIIKDIMDEKLWKCLEPCMVIHEWMRYEDLIVLYQQMHFLVIAREVSQRTLANFPSKVPECMSLGVVPIVSDVGDYTKYYLKDGVDSIFIQGDSVEEIRKSVRKAETLTDRQFKELSENAVLCAKTQFDYRVWTDKVLEMLKMESKGEKQMAIDGCNGLEDKICGDV